MAEYKFEHEFEVWQDGSPVASATSDNRAAAMREALHYAAVYSQDGPVTVYDVKRTEMEIKDAAEWLASAVAPSQSRES